jgi:hypothetical protein
VVSGYNAPVVDRFSGGVEITNLHADDYGISPEQPLQGIFTEQWVGGREYRHIRLNVPSSTKNGPNNLDSADDRPEGFKLLLGPILYYFPQGMNGTDAGTGMLTQSHPTGALGIVDPQYPEPFAPAVRPPYMFNRPKANMTRGHVTKRPVNIKNILMTTSSLSQSVSGVLIQGRIGNYQKNYQVVQSAGRSINDPFWQDQSFTFGGGALNPETLATRGRLLLTGSEGGGPSRETGANTSGSLDYELPNRTDGNSNKTVFVNLFSAPGSYEVLSRGYRDVAHEEKSVYNALPFRNLSVRGSSSGDSESVHVHDHLANLGYYTRGLRTLLTLHAGQFGTDAQYGSVLSSTYNTTPSFHKVNRNRKYRLELSGTRSDDVAATATITITDYTELNNGDKVNLIATDGSNYDFTAGDQSSANGTFEATTSNNATAANLMNVINTSNGPAGTRFTATVDGAVVTVTQAVPSTAGNTTITLTDSGDAGMSKTNFTGGIDYILTGSVYDNGWITHPIPRSARQYAWVTASMRVDATMFGYNQLALTSSVQRGGVWTQEGINITSSDFGSFVASGVRKFGRDKTDAMSPAEDLSTPFNGMNTNVREPISCQHNYLGYYKGYKEDPGANTNDIQEIGFYINQGDEDTARLGPPHVAATAVDCIDTTGLLADRYNDASFTISISTAAGGLGGTAITFLLDASESTSGTGGANQIMIGTDDGITDAARAALIIKAINAVTDSKVNYATSGNGQAGYDIGVTAAEGSSDTQITLTMDTAGTAGNITSALASVSGVDIIDVTDFTGGVQGQITGGLIDAAIITNDISAGQFRYDATGLNAVLLHRNGPYQYPSWKQLRTGEHPIVRYKKTINVMSVDDPLPAPLPSGLPLSPTSFTSHIVQPLYTHHHPLQVAFGRRAEANEPPVLVMATWANNLDYFVQEPLNTRLNTYKEPVLGHAYDSLINYMLNIPSSQDAIFNHSQQIYPRPINTFQNKVRARTKYTSRMGLASSAEAASIWNDSRTIRSLTPLPTATTPTGIRSRKDSQGNTVLNLSCWSTDGRKNFTTTYSLPTSSDAGTNDSAGELLNNYSWYGTTGSNTIKPAACAWMRVPVGSGSYHGTTDPIYMGDAEFGFSSLDRPYREYEDYTQFIRLDGKEYSIVPEFRIERWIPKIINEKDGDWLQIKDNVADGLGIFDLTGSYLDTDSSGVGTKVCNIENTDEFYKVYGHADFLKYFKIIDDSLNDKITGDGSIVNKRLILQAEAKMKFLPYKGFYVHERVLELARQYSSSYSHYTETQGKTSGNFTNHHAAWRTMIAPLFSPGIWFNSIKSAIGVSSYCIYQEPPVDGDPADMNSFKLTSANTVLPEGRINFGDAVLSMSNAPAGAGKIGLHVLPWETVLNPRAHLTMGEIGPIPGDGYIYDYGCGSASLASNTNPSFTHNRALWKGDGDPLYEMMADNFACNMIDFFLKKGPDRPSGLTTMLSRDASHWKTLKKDQMYALTINLNRTMKSNGQVDRDSWNMCNRASSFGMPIQGTGDEHNKALPVSAAFGHAVPSYYYGTSSVTIAYKAPFNGAPSIDDLRSNATFIYNSSPDYNNISHTSPGWQHKQQISSSVNLLEELRTSTTTRWLVQSKFETPLLHISPTAATQPLANPNVGTRGYIDVDTSISSSGIMLQPGALPGTTGRGQAAGVFLSVTTPESVTVDGETFKAGTLNEGGIQTLADAVGFNTTMKFPIGAIKNEHLLEEAVIVAPFVCKENEKKFFEMKADNPQWVDATRLLNKYIFPPSMDFIRNDITPKLFYAFEFNMPLDRDALVKIFQQMLPDDGTVSPPVDKGRPDSTNFEPVPEAREQACTCSIEDVRLINQIYGCIDELKWVVFKVKYRGANNYDRYTKKNIIPYTQGEKVFDRRRTDPADVPPPRDGGYDRSQGYDREVVETGVRDEARYIPTITPRIDSKYSYNWPYDQCSIVETLKISAQAQYRAVDLARLQGEITSHVAGAPTSPLNIMSTNIRNVAYGGTATATAQCVVEGTLIHTNRGEIPVENVTAEDKIYAYDFEKKEFGYYDILGLSNSIEKRWVKLITEGDYELGCSDTHSLYNNERLFDKIYIEDLVAGDMVYILRDENLARDIIKTIEFIEEEVRVYNFSVDKVQAYFSDGILSHNMAINVRMCPDGTVAPPGEPCPQPPPLGQTQTGLKTSMAAPAVPASMLGGRPSMAAPISQVGAPMGGAGMLKAGSSKEEALMRRVFGSGGQGAGAGAQARNLI